MQHFFCNAFTIWNQILDLHRDIWTYTCCHVKFEATRQNTLAFGLWIRNIVKGTRQPTLSGTARKKRMDLWWVLKNTKKPANNNSQNQGWKRNLESLNFLAISTLLGRFLFAIFTGKCLLLFKKVSPAR